LARSGGGRVPCAHRRGVEQFGQLAGLITRRSQVQILPPLLREGPSGPFRFSWVPCGCRSPSGRRGRTARGGGGERDPGVVRTVGVGRLTCAVVAKGRVRPPLGRDRAQPHRRLGRLAHGPSPGPHRCRTPRHGPSSPSGRPPPLRGSAGTARWPAAVGLRGSRWQERPLSPGLRRGVVVGRTTVVRWPGRWDRGDRTTSGTDRMGAVPGCGSRGWPFTVPVVRQLIAEGGLEIPAG
jgi:hypothetical protein